MRPLWSGPVETSVSRLHTRHEQRTIHRVARIESLAIINSANDPLWNTTAQEIERAMLSALHQNAFNMPPERLDAVAAVAPARACIILHAVDAPADLREQITARSDTCWILASGGVTVTTHGNLPPTAFLTHVSNVYGRTEYFSDWLDAWIRAGLTTETFTGTVSELETPTAPTFRASIRRLQAIVRSIRVVTTAATAATATASEESVLAWVRHAIVLATQTIDRERFADDIGFFRFGTKVTVARTRLLALLEGFLGPCIRTMDELRAMHETLDLAVSLFGKDTRYLQDQVDLIIESFRHRRDGTDGYDSDSDPAWLLGSPWMHDAIARAITRIYPPADDRRRLIQSTLDIDQTIEDLTLLRTLVDTFEYRLSGVLHDAKALARGAKSLVMILERQEEDELRSKTLTLLEHDGWRLLPVVREMLHTDFGARFGLRMNSDFEEQRRAFALIAEDLPKRLRGLRDLSPTEIKTALEATVEETRAIFEFLSHLRSSRGFGEYVIDLDSSLVRKLE